MRKIIDIVFANLPRMEVWARIIYKRLKIPKDGRIAKGYQRTRGIQTNSVDERLWEKYVVAIKSLGINKGDILIVHSSFDGLSKMGKSMDEIIDFLISLVGGSGTLVMPAYPYYLEEKVVLEYDEKEEKTKKYNPRVTPAWTGELPNALCGRKESVRSFYPNNTLVAIGKDAEQMMQHNLEGDLSHGMNSAWEYCSKMNAKILYIGVEPFHALSAIHIVEDSLDDKWPIVGWYKKQKYEIKIDGKKIEKECRVRKKFWTKYLTEQYCVSQLEKNSIIENYYVDGIPLSFISSLNGMTEFVMGRVLEGDLLFYKIPKKYWKK